VEPNKLDLFETSEVSKLELHTPEVQLIDSSKMWKKEGNINQESGALVTVPGSDPKTLSELVEFFDIPTHCDETDDFRRTNHCTTFGNEDLWPL